MAMDRVWARFLYARARPTGLPQKPEPAPFNKQVFFCAPDPPRRAP